MSDNARHRTVAHLDDAIAACVLSEREREVYRLTCQEDMNCYRIAQILRCHPGTVRNDLVAIRKRLKQAQEIAKEGSPNLNMTYCQNGEVVTREDATPAAADRTIRRSHHQKIPLTK